MNLLKGQKRKKESRQIQIENMTGTSPATSIILINVNGLNSLIKDKLRLD